MNAAHVKDHDEQFHVFHRPVASIVFHIKKWCSHNEWMARTGGRLHKQATSHYILTGDYQSPWKQSTHGGRQFVSSTNMATLFVCNWLGLLYRFLEIHNYWNSFKVLRHCGPLQGKFRPLADQNSSCGAELSAIAIPCASMNIFFLELCRSRVFILRQHNIFNKKLDLAHISYIYLLHAPPPTLMQDNDNNFEKMIQELLLHQCPLV